MKNHSMSAGTQLLSTLLIVATLVLGTCSQSHADDLCATDQIWLQYRNADPSILSAHAGPCDKGVCDDASFREPHIPDSTQPITYVRLRFHLLAMDDGSNPVGTMELLETFIDTLNYYFLPSRIQFVTSARFVNSSLYRFVPFSLTNLTPMFNMFRALSESPETQLNIFITQPTGLTANIAPVAPWVQPVTITKDYGIMIAKQTDFTQTVGRKTMAHEIGHALGLWHTHFGVSEVSLCSQCYESMASVDRNTVGDFCSDTDPNLLSFSCANPGGTDGCSGLPWGTTNFRNIMGYAQPPCPYDFFTPQQSGRMHCWLRNTAIGGWIVGATATASETFGPAPLTVDFAGSSSSTVSDWNWNFGDGGVDSVQNPSHVYQSAGLYDVTITTQTTEGTQVSPNPNMIWAWGDTLALDTLLVGTNQKFKIDINGSTHLPLTQMTIPISWSGPLALPLDSIRMTGLRTAGLILDTLHQNLPGRQIVVRLRSTGSGSIPTGDGPILSLWFRSPIIKLPGINQINVQSLAGYDPLCVALPGFFTPVVSAQGAVTMSCCIGTRGNADNDPLQSVDIADLTTLVDHLFITFTPLACADEGNLDAIGGVDIADLTMLVDHLFISFTPLGGC